MHIMIQTMEIYHQLMGVANPSSGRIPRAGARCEEWCGAR